MKKIICLLSLSLLLCLPTVNSKAAATSNTMANKEVVTNMTAEEKQARIVEITMRVNEIKNMDRSDLTRSDRKALRTELRALKTESRGLGGGGGIYLSVGAIIIIILLLILIL